MVSSPTRTHVLLLPSKVAKLSRDEREMDPDAEMKVSLWRPDMLTGVIELRDDLTIARADTSAGLVLGWPLPRMHGRELTRFLHCPRGLTYEDLMGAKGRGGGSRRMPVAGPRKAFEGRHSDGMPLQLTLQGAQKNGKERRRAVIMIKVGGCLHRRRFNCARTSSQGPRYSWVFVPPVLPLSRAWNPGSGCLHGRSYGRIRHCASTPQNSPPRASRCSPPTRALWSSCRS